MRLKLQIVVGVHQPRNHILDIVRQAMVGGKNIVEAVGGFAGRCP